MGAKQSKRSVDISGKEAESAGEVAAAIAGGEGRVEQLADADALKPQLNGDAHIHDTEEKQKDIDSGTPENEKDDTTEKEGKKEVEPEATPLTNGENEQKIENGDSTPTSEDGKKPKKEKVKKKWSLRSISFSRKDKPKQEKKAKDEEPKTNGDPDKVPEETADVVPEVPVASTETAEETKTPSDTKDDKTPETPVTEPITNGSSIPESPKVETPVVEKPVVTVPNPESERPESKSEKEIEQLPVNGLSLEEPAKEISENDKKNDSIEKLTAETTEIVPEILVKKEVCVEQMPLLDSTPPPLPVNPPPSSVASFAATTMAPELTDASLANTANSSILSSPLSGLNVNDELDNIPLEPKDDLTVNQTIISNVLPLKEAIQISPTISETEINKDTIHTVSMGINTTAILVGQIECQAIEKPTTETVTMLDNAKPVAITGSSKLIQDVTENEIVREESLEIAGFALPDPIDLYEESIIEKLEGVDVSNPTLQLNKDPAVERKTQNTLNTENIDIIIPSETVKDDIGKKEIISGNIELPGSELIEKSIIEHEINVMSGYVSQELPAPHVEIVEKSTSINDIAKEGIPINSRFELPAPPMEVVENSGTVNDIGEEEMLTISKDEISASPVKIVQESDINDTSKEDMLTISGVEVPTSIEVPVTVCCNRENHLSAENLPSPPPPLCDEVVFNIPMIATASLESDTQIISEINGVTNIFCNKADTKGIFTETELLNDNKDLIKNVINKSKNSLGNLIETIECNGNFKEDKAASKESTEIIVPSSVKEMADVDVTESGSRTQPYSEQFSTEPRPTTPQEVLPASEKLADLIPEVPEVPEIITETETTNDVAVTN